MEAHWKFRGAGGFQNPNILKESKKLKVLKFPEGCVGGGEGWVGVKPKNLLWEGIISGTIN